MVKKYGFRKYSEDYLQKRQERYSYVALEVKKVICQCGYNDTEESFELAKKWILSNEQLSIIQSFGDTIRELLEYISTWIPIMVSFALGVLTTILSNNTEKIFSKSFWGCFFLTVIMGFVFELLIKTLCINIEKLSVRILKEMTYDEYRLLSSLENNNKKENRGKENGDD